MLLIIGRLLNQIPSFHYSQQTRKIPNMAFTFNWLVRNQFWRRKCLIWNEGEWLFDSIYRRSWVFRNDTVKFLKEIFWSDEVLLNWAFLKLYLQELDFHVFLLFECDSINIDIRQRQFLPTNVYFGMIFLKNGLKLK